MRAFRYRAGQRVGKGESVGSRPVPLKERQDPPEGRETTTASLCLPLLQVACTRSRTPCRWPLQPTLKGIFEGLVSGSKHAGMLMPDFASIDLVYGAARAATYGRPFSARSEGCRLAPQASCERDRDSP